MKTRGYSLIEGLVVLIILAILIAAGVEIYVNMREKARQVQENAIVAALQTAIKSYYSRNLRWPVCPPFMDEANLNPASPFYWWVSQGCGAAPVAAWIYMQYAPSRAFNVWGTGDQWTVCKTPGACQGAACTYQIWCPHSRGESPKRGNYWEYNAATGVITKDPLKQYPGHH